MFRPFSNGPQPPPPPRQPPYSASSWYPSAGVARPPPPPPPPTGFNPLLGADSRPDSPQRPSTPQGSTQQLHDKSPDELRKLLTDKEAYEKYLHSIEEVRQLDTLRNDLRRSNINLAKQNLSKEPEFAELRNQCIIIRTTQLAAAREKLAEAQLREKEILARISPAALIQKLQEAANEADDESEVLHRKLLNNQVELAEFLHRYKQLRVLYHRRTLVRMAAVSSSSPG